MHKRYGMPCRLTCFASVTLGFFEMPLPSRMTSLCADADNMVVNTKPSGRDARANDTGYCWGRIRAGHALVVLGRGCSTASSAAPSATASTASTTPSTLALRPATAPPRVRHQRLERHVELVHPAAAAAAAAAARAQGQRSLSVARRAGPTHLAPPEVPPPLRIP